MKYIFENAPTGTLINGSFIYLGEKTFYGYIYGGRTYGYITCINYNCEMSTLLRDNNNYLFNHAYSISLFDKRSIADSSSWYALELTNVSSGEVHYIKDVNGIVHLTFHNITLPATDQYYTIGTLPSGYRPGWGQTIRTSAGDIYGEFNIKIDFLGVIECHAKNYTYLWGGVETSYVGF